MNKVSPFLWFEKGAEDAAQFYVDTFNGSPGKRKKSKITTRTTYDENSAKASGQPEGSVMIIGFEIEGSPFTAINGGPALKMSGGVSFVIECENQEEVDYFWEKLSSGGEAGVCGWINHDKYGMTWQVVPAGMSKYIAGKNPEGQARAMKAMLEMSKLDITALKKAYQGA